jgi:Glyoxalase/Bleomycin resistance protein/Dioxygenase superfamily
VCNARLSDRIGDAPLLRIDAIHHTIALFPAARAGIQHINHQVESEGDILRSYHFLRERQVDIVFGPGRPPTSSATFPYFQGPDGMVFEYSSGVCSIADQLLYRERQFSFEPKGFCQWGQAQDRRVSHLRAYHAPCSRSGLEPALLPQQPAARPVALGAAIPRMSETSSANVAASS